MVDAKEQIQSDVKEAMRSRDSKTLGALRLITAAIKQIEVDERIVVDESRLLTLLGKLAKQREESIRQFQVAGRDDLVAQEQFELDLIRKYLPRPLSQEALEALITQALKEAEATKMSDMGKVMTILKPQIQGRADMSKVSALIKDKLS
ncbi:MAG: GatB/YqeY domain-containing protein [Legionella sp.]|nr:GatB/YqeY domain-containing protein [Legionella sp.]